MPAITEVDSTTTKGFMIELSKSEALTLISSLADQIKTENCNSGRPEWMNTNVIRCKNGVDTDIKNNRYLSIAVVPHRK